MTHIRCNCRVGVAKIVFVLTPASLLATVLLPVATAQKIFVSTKGSDSARGDQASPVRSVERALELAREKHGHEIQLQSGVYRLESTLTLTSADSGLTLRATRGQNVMLSGGRRIEGWKPVSEGESLWSAQLPKGVAVPRQIYIDGVRAGRAKGKLPVGLTSNEHGYTAASELLAHWRRPQDLEFVYTGGNRFWGVPSAGLGSWTEPRCPVASIRGAVIEMAEPCWTNSTHRVTLPSSKVVANLVGPASFGKEPAYIDNAYELLGRPGEFYADNATRTIYYTPRKGEDLRAADVEAPVLESLLAIVGSESKPVKNVTIEGITFAFAAWDGPSTPEGFSEIQANYRVTGPDGATKQGLCTLVPGGLCPYAAWTPEPGNVSTYFADDIHFERDTFTHLGGAGLALSGGAHQDLVQGCTFTDISGNGLELGGVDAPEALDAAFPVGNRIRNNLFRNVGAEFRGGIPIVVGYARFTQIEHNQIDHVPYAAISVGWGGWPDKIALPGVTNRSTHNVIANNRIEHLMLALADGGGIYTQGRTGKTLADGELVEGNVITDQFGTGHGVYTDDGSAMITVRGNAFFNTNYDNWASRQKNYYDGATGQDFGPLAIEGNWWQQGDPDSSAKQVVEKGNHLITALSQVPASLLRDAGLQNEYADLLLPPQVKVPPEAPASVGVFETPTEAYVTWRPSVFEGGATVDHYGVRSSDGLQTTLSAEDFDRSSYVRIPLKPSAEPRTFTVVSANSAGESPASLPSSPVEPTRDALPGAPQLVTAQVEGDRASIHFAVPKENGEHVFAYRVTVEPGGRQETFMGRRLITLSGRHVTFVTLDGLTPGVDYSFGIAAVNPAGEGETATVKSPVAAIKR